MPSHAIALSGQFDSPAAGQRWRQALRTIALAMTSLAAASLGTSQAQSSADTASAPAQPQAWVTAWASPPSDALALFASLAPPPFMDMTLRSAMRVATDGRAVRVRLSNDLGDQPLVIDHVTIARQDGTGMTRVEFGGAATVTIPAGGSVVSDPVAMGVAALDKLMVSVHVPGPVMRLTAHALSQGMTWSAPGDQAASPQLRSALPGFSRFIVSQIDVLSGAPEAGTLAIIGDSITDGYLSTLSADRRWPDRLAERFVAAGQRGRGIANLGISGNRLLKEGWGVAAVDRLDRDVFSLPNVDQLVIFIGVNDLGVNVAEGVPVPPVEEMVAGYTSIVSAARAKGIRVIAATILPYGGASPFYYNAEANTVRKAVNDWMRTSPLFDSVLDFDRLCADPSDPDRLSAPCDGGDGLHPADEGFAIMAGAFPVNP